MHSTVFEHVHGTIRYLEGETNIYDTEWHRTRNGDFTDSAHVSRLSLSEMLSGGEAAGDLMSSCLAGHLRCKCDLILWHRTRIGNFSDSARVLVFARGLVWGVFIRGFHKHTTLAIMPILASEALLRENKKIQCYPPVGIEPRPLMNL